MATEESGDGRRYRRASLFLAGTHATLSGWTEIISSYDPVVVKGTKEDGLSDLRDLQIRPGLPAMTFKDSVRNTLLLMPAFARIIEDVPQSLTDAEGTARVEEARPDLEEQDAKEQWRIVRDWIESFFGDIFEVAPASFVTRLRSRH